VPSEDSLLVTCDPGQFDQLLFNLAVQAKDSLGVGGSVEIRLARATLGTHDVLSPGEYVEMTVSENTRAPEPPRGTLPPGVRGGSERSSGLGLATCHAIVERAQGVLVVSDRDGGGTRFRVLLPRGQEPGRVEPRRSSLAPLTLQGTVLVVEDHPTILRTMVRALAQTGLRVFEAGSGEDALAVLESGGRICPELIVIDVVLPHMSGPRLVERLRVDNPNLKALYVSGYVGEEFAHSVRIDENTGFVMKPFSGRQLAVRAAAMLGAKANEDVTVTVNGNR
jgi:two-component system cell cycle sensor histidine kinase/response regulator CckA